MSAFITALTAVWPLLAAFAVLAAAAVQVVRWREERIEREAEEFRHHEHVADLEQQIAVLRQRLAAQAPRRRGQDVADPWGRPVYDPQRAVEFEVEHRPRWET